MANSDCPFNHWFFYDILNSAEGFEGCLTRSKKQGNKIDILPENFYECDFKEGDEKDFIYCQRYLEERKRLEDL